MAIVVVIGVVSGGGWIGVRWINHVSMEERFGKDLQAYIALMPVLRPSRVRNGQMPPQNITGKIRGRMVVVNSVERKIDNIHFALPSDLQATRPEEVATVVLLTYGEMQMSDGDGIISQLMGIEYQQFIQITVFDWNSKKEIDSGTVYGRDSGRRDRPGPKPDDAQVLKFLESLPRDQHGGN
jgi:hypothetical protein